MDASASSRSRAPVSALACAILLGLTGTLAACGAEPGEQAQVTDMAPRIDRSAPALAEQNVADNTEAGDTAEVITTGSATVRTDDPSTAAAEFIAAVKEQGGRVADSQTSSDLGQPRSMVTVRVPAEKYQAVVDALPEYGEILAQSTQATDVGQQRVDLEARQKALQASVDRLTELMTGATTVEDLLRAEDTLTQRQADLDALTAQLDYLADRVAMSTLTVDFVVDDADHLPPNLFERSWEAFLRSLETLVIVAVGSLPWLVVLGALAAVAAALVRRRRHRRHPRPGTENEPPATSAD